MTKREISEQLLRLVSSYNLVGSLYELTDAWSAAGVGEECIEPILEFVEAHPDLDYGVPGPLVHFLELLDDKEYEEKLIESIGRKPTDMTVRMINRVINGTAEPTKRALLISTMRRAATNPKTSPETIERINDYLDYQEGLK
jgi:hypothetical protein